MFAFFSNSNNNAFETAKLLTELLNVNITHTTLKQEIEEHPDSSSLLCISDVLGDFGVSNLSIKLNISKLQEVPTPFITIMKGEKSSMDFFAVVKEIDGNNLIFFNPEKRKWSTIDKTTFEERFSGTVLLAEVEDRTTVGEKDFATKSKNEKRNEVIQRAAILYLPIFVGLFGLFSFVNAGVHALLPVIYSFLTLIGSAVSVLLLWYEVDQHNPVLQQICSSGGKANCNTILKSNAAKIAGISWSSIGFTYFIGQLFFLLSMGMLNAPTLFVTFFMSLLALPYIFFSIYYQLKIAKQWCIMCLCVQGVLVLQFSTAVMGRWYSLSTLANLMHSNSILVLFVVFSLLFLMISSLIPLLEKNKVYKNYKNELRRLKQSPEIFNALLMQQKAILEPTSGLGITLGNHGAKYQLIKVCSPYCDPCARAHIPLEALVENNPNVQVQIIFTATNTPGDDRTPPVKHLLAIAETCKDDVVIKHALDDWYLAENKDYRAFAEKYPINEALLKQDAKIEAMRSWCNKTKIEFTPTFFINGHQLPPMYNIGDLKYFLTA